MSPFAAALYSIRLERNICQAELSELIGYEQAYISALEVGAKGPPTEAFVDKLITELNITGEEQARLLEAANASSRKLVIPCNAPKDVYWLLSDLKKYIHNLSTAQIQLLRQILPLQETINVKPQTELNRVKRRKKEEVNM